MNKLLILQQQYPDSHIEDVSELPFGTIGLTKFNVPFIKGNRKRCGYPGVFCLDVDKLRGAWCLGDVLVLGHIGVECFNEYNQLIEQPCMDILTGL